MITWQQWSEMQIPTQRYGRRPYGVGLLVAGYDVSKSDCHLSCQIILWKLKKGFLFIWCHWNVIILIVSWSLPNINIEKNKLDTFVFPKDIGPHIYQTCPSANYFDCKAMAIGARSQVIALFFFFLLTSSN